MIIQYITIYSVFFLEKCVRIGNAASTRVENTIVSVWIPELFEVSNNVPVNVLHLAELVVPLLS